MKKWLAEILSEVKKFDLEVLTIILYSCFILLFSIYLKRTKIFFANEPFLEKLLITGFIYLTSPFLHMVLFKNKPKDYGISLGKIKIWIKDLAFFFCIMLIVLILAFKFSNLGSFYPLYKKAGKNWNFFITYELIQLFHMFAWEFFFRGFMLFGLAKKIDYRIAILTQTIPFALLHYRKPPLEAYGSILAGFFLGIMGIRAHSFIPCAMLHFLVALTGDILGIFLTLKS